MSLIKTLKRRGAKIDTFVDFNTATYNSTDFYLLLAIRNVGP